MRRCWCVYYSEVLNYTPLDEYFLKLESGKLKKGVPEKVLGFYKTMLEYQDQDGNDANDEDEEMVDEEEEEEGGEDE